MVIADFNLDSEQKIMYGMILNNQKFFNFICSTPMQRNEIMKKAVHSSPHK